MAFAAGVLYRALYLRFWSDFKSWLGVINQMSDSCFSNNNVLRETKKVYVWILFCASSDAEMKWDNLLIAFDKIIARKYSHCVILSASLIFVNGNLFWIRHQQHVSNKPGSLTHAFAHRQQTVMTDQPLKPWPAVCISPSHPADVPCPQAIVFLPLFINRYLPIPSSRTRSSNVEGRRNWKEKGNNGAS